MTMCCRFVNLQLRPYIYRWITKCRCFGGLSDGLSRIPAISEEECSFSEILRAITGASTVPVEDIPLTTCFNLKELPSVTCEDKEIPYDTLESTALPYEH